MAQSGETHPHEALPQETKAHEATYAGFMRLLKLGTIVTVVVTAFVVFLIAS